ncbi:MAG: hypothetical protein MKZ93_06655 [Prochlorococcus sp. ALOHA_A2.0_51]|nr:hypothetical protein [Prochlorococcus sp. ALOHA_A2.0_51]
MVTRPRQVQLRWLHGLSRLMLLGQRQDRLKRSPKMLAARRSKQRRQLARQILEIPSEQWLRPKSSGEWIWRALRWGGPGVALGWWLSQSG